MNEITLDNLNTNLTNNLTAGILIGYVAVMFAFMKATIDIEQDDS